MNYIKQLTAAMTRFTDDERLNPAHVSLYLALFQLWNINRFRNPISINRTEVMKISKIGSRVTYHKCIKELHAWRYLEYRPSHNPLKGSKVYMFNFETSDKQVLEQVPGQLVGPLNKQYKQNKQTKTERRPTLKEVLNFFNEEFSSFGGNTKGEEAKKFFNYYKANGWKVGKNPMEDWQAAAQNWMLKANQFTNQKPVVQKRDNLQTDNNKSYDQPL